MQQQNPNVICPKFAVARVVELSVAVEKYQQRLAEIIIQNTYQQRLNLQKSGKMLSYFTTFIVN